MDLIDIHRIVHPKSKGYILYSTAQHMDALGEKGIRHPGVASASGCEPSGPLSKQPSLVMAEPSPQLQLFFSKLFLCYLQNFADIS